jgi:glycosyltransferase involved in cell wall biosynthesis
VGRLTILVAEGWFGGSHRRWACGWAAASEHDIRLVTLPAARWKWRLRAGAVRLADAVRADIEANGRPDLIVISSMVDAASLVGIARRALDGVPMVAYLHENQLTQPSAPGQNVDEGLALTQWRSMVAADEVWFNSAFHRDDLLAALPGLLNRDRAAESQGDLLDAVARRCRVVPLGVDTADLVAAHRAVRSGPPVVVFNHRIAHDKDPAAVLDALATVAGRGIDFELVVTGEGLTSAPSDVRGGLRALGERVRATGPLDRGDYLRLLCEVDVVVSAARHEFFGVSVVEAMAAGAVPVLPDRLSYPEVVPDRFHDVVLHPEGALTERLATVLGDIDGARRRTAGLRAAMLAHDWGIRGPVHDDAARTVTVASGRPN